MKLYLVIDAIVDLVTDVTHLNTEIIKTSFKIDYPDVTQTIEISFDCVTPEMLNDKKKGDKQAEINLVQFENWSFGKR